MAVGRGRETQPSVWGFLETPSKADNEVGSGSSRPEWEWGRMVAVPSRWTRMAGGDGKGASGSSHAHGE